MKVELYVYDLTRGMARAMSRQILGTQIDAVYHTSLVFNNVEYFFGMGIQTCYPGSTHHGQPMEIVGMGSTELPMDTILEYLESLKEIYSPESYDLFAHNCNNFTNDLAMFLVGRGIPDHITNLPKKVLDTPFGQMLKPQIDQSMRSITQAPVASTSQARPSTTNGTRPVIQQNTAPTSILQTKLSSPYGSVINITTLSIMREHLQKASNTASTIFFTSSTCAPCKIAYPMFDQLAGQNPQALFIKVDINSAREIAAQYQIRATPSFLTFSKDGVQKDSWTGADPNLLKANVERLINETFPPHPHTLLKVPSLQFGSLKPVTYTRTPPLEKILSKLGNTAKEEEILALSLFVEKRSANPKNATLPDLHSIGKAFQTKVLALPAGIRFAAVDLLRCAMIDSRVGGFFAEEQRPQTIAALVKHVSDLDDCPHNLRLVTIHLACNIFITPLYIEEILRNNNELASLLVQLIASSLLDASHPTTRVAAASLAFNLASSNYITRRQEGREALGESEQVELAASIIEALSAEENTDAVKALLLALGYLVYCAPVAGEVMETVKVLDAKQIVGDCKGQQALAKEAANLL